MPIFTDKYAESLSSLPTDEEEAAEVVADAERVYAYVRRNEFLDEAKLVQYGERQLSLDRLRAALAFLRETGKLHVVSEAPGGAASAPDAPAPSTAAVAPDQASDDDGEPDRRPYEKRSAADLRKLAAERGVQVPARASKAALIDALR